MKLKSFGLLAICIAVAIFGSCTILFPEVDITIRNSSTDAIISAVVHPAASTDRPPSASENLLSEPLQPGGEFTFSYPRDVVDIEIAFEHLNPIAVRDIDLYQCEMYKLTIDSGGI